MRICYLNSYDSPLGGSQRAWHFTEFFAANDIKVDFVTSSFNHLLSDGKLRVKEFLSNYKNENINVKFIKNIQYNKGSRSRRLLHLIFHTIQTAYFLIKNIRKYQRIIVTNVPLPFSFFILILFFSNRHKIILEVRDIWPEELILLGYLKSNSLAVKLLKFMEEFCYKHSSYVVTSLSHSLNHIGNYKDAKLISIIPNPVITNHYLEYNGGQLRSLSLLYYGGSGKANDIEHIINSFLNLSNELKISLTIIGLSALEAKKRGYRGLDKIHFLPLLPKIELNKYVDKADVLLASFDYSDFDIFGINSNKLIEYIASNRPTIFRSKNKNNIFYEEDLALCTTSEDINGFCDLIRKVYYMTPSHRAATGAEKGTLLREMLGIKKLGRKYIDVLYHSY